MDVRGVAVSVRVRPCPAKGRKGLKGRTALLALLLAGCAGEPQPGGTHRFFPLRPGAEWVYAAAGINGTETRRVVRTAGKGERVLARLETEAPYDVRPMWAASGPDGIRLLPAISRRVPADIVIDDAPLLLPPDSAVTAGGSWSYHGVVPFALAESLGEPETDSPAPMMSAECRAGRLEEITVPAGRFRAIKVTARCRYALQPPIEADEVYWYAPEVGLVKHTAAVAGRPSVSWELVRVAGLGK